MTIIFSIFMVAVFAYIARRETLNKWGTDAVRISIRPTNNTNIVTKWKIPVKGEIEAIKDILGGNSSSFVTLDNSGEIIIVPYEILHNSSIRVEFKKRLFVSK